MKKDDIKEAVNLFSNYSLNALAIVNSENKLLGRITHDEIRDVMQDQDTKQLYSLAGVDNKVEEVESIIRLVRIGHFG